MLLQGHDEKIKETYFFFRPTEKVYSGNNNKPNNYILFVSIPLPLSVSYVCGQTMTFLFQNWRKPKKRFFSSFSSEEDLWRAELTGPINMQRVNLSRKEINRAKTNLFSFRSGIIKNTFFLEFNRISSSGQE